MKKLNIDVSKIFTVSRVGGSLRITIPKDYCRDRGIEAGYKLAVRPVGSRCLLIGSPDDVFNPNGIILNFGKEVEDDK